MGGARLDRFPRERPANASRKLLGTSPHLSGASHVCALVGAARPRVGFASTSPTTSPHRADGRVPGGRF